MTCRAAIVVVCLAVGCAGPLLTAAGQKVTLNEAAPRPGCQVVGPVRGDDVSGVGATVGEESRAAIRNRAGAQGANYVRLEDVSRTGIASGTAFKCPASAWAALTGNKPMDASANTAARFVAAHAAARAAHCADALVWSDTLAGYAQRWAEHIAASGCVAAHSSGEYGENVITGTLGPEDAVGIWYDEIAQYDFQRGGVAPETGNFAQIVWRATKQVGCGHAACDNRDVWVCEYDLPVDSDASANVLPTSCERDVSKPQTSVATSAIDRSVTFVADPANIRGVVLEPIAMGLPGVPLVYMRLKMSIDDHRVALANAKTPAMKQIEAVVVATMLYNQAKTEQGAAQQQTWVAARQVLRDVVRSVGQADASTLRMLASFEILLADYPAAERVWGELVAKAPDDHDEPYNRAWWLYALLRQSKTQEAVAALGNEPITVAQPELAYIAAWTKFRDGDMPGAWQAIVAALAGWGNRGARDKLRDDVLLFAARTGTAMAVAFNDIEPLLAKGDKAVDARLYIELAWTYQLAGRWVDAIAALDQALDSAQLPVEAIPDLRFDQADFATRLDAPDVVARYAKQALTAIAACGPACDPKAMATLVDRTYELAHTLGVLYANNNDPRYYEPAIAIYDGVEPMLGSVPARQALAHNERAMVDQWKRRLRPGVGKHDKAAIGPLLSRHNQEVQACYEQALSGSPTLSGSLTLRLDVDQSGVVTDARTEPDAGSGDLAVVAGCVIARARSWKLPAQGAPGSTRIQLGFTLAPKT